MHVGYAIIHKLVLCKKECFIKTNSANYFQQTVKLIFPVLVMSFLVFAVFGVVLFEKYTNSNVEGLLYKNDFKWGHFHCENIVNSSFYKIFLMDVLAFFFRGLSSAFITLFSIFTFEHWLDLLKDIQKVPELNHRLCGLFVMVWFVFGALMTCVFMTLISKYSYNV